MRVLLAFCTIVFGRCLITLLLGPLLLLLGFSLASANPQVPPVMSPHTWAPDMDIQGWWMSEKYDGIRGYWTGRQLISRIGNVFVTPRGLRKIFPQPRWTVNCGSDIKRSRNSPASFCVKPRMRRNGNASAI